MILKNKKRFLILFFLGTLSFRLVEATEDSPAQTEWYFSEELFNAIEKRQLPPLSSSFKAENKGNAEIRLLGKDTSLDHLLNEDIAFLAGTITYEGSLLNIMLVAERNAISKDIDFSWLYLSEEEVSPSAKFFLDVCHYINSSPQFSEIVREVDRQDTPMYIERTEKRKDLLLPINKTRHVAQGATYAKWSFLSQGKLRAFYVIAIPVKEGGTDFAVELLE